MDGGRSCGRRLRVQGELETGPGVDWRAVLRMVRMAGLVRRATDVWSTAEKPTLQAMGGFLVGLAFSRKERRAPELVEPTGLEPSRSLLWRSAASLALDAGLIDEARELIERGLRGGPPADVAAELRDLLEECDRRAAGGGGSWDGC